MYFAYQMFRDTIKLSSSKYILLLSKSIPSLYSFIIVLSLEYIPFTNTISPVYFKYLYTASNNKSDASPLLYNGLKSNPEYPVWN